VAPEVSGGGDLSVFARFGIPAHGKSRPYDALLMSRGRRCLIDYSTQSRGRADFWPCGRTFADGNLPPLLLLGHADQPPDSDSRNGPGRRPCSGPIIVVVNRTNAQLRGRAPGTYPWILRTNLKRSGLPESALPVSHPRSRLHASPRLGAAPPRRSGVFPMHSQTARAAVIAMLDNHAGLDRSRRIRLIGGSTAATPAAGEAGCPGTCVSFLFFFFFCFFFFIFFFFFLFFFFLFFFFCFFFFFYFFFFFFFFSIDRRLGLH